MTGKEKTVTVSELGAIITGIFEKAGFSALQARTISATILAGERDNCKSHGIFRIEGCLATVQAGKVDHQAEPEVVDEGGAIIRVNANNAFSTAAFDLGLPHLVERTKKLGMAAMVINDCTHFSALWPEIEALTTHGLAAMAMCPSYAVVAPAGGTTPLLGTNPFAFGWPRQGQEPYVFDFATSIAARGEIELYLRAGKPLPEGWAIDSEGKPTTDPKAALEGAMLPFGAHKGSAISTMIELMAGIMIGDLTSSEALNFLGTTALSPRHGELVIAFDPAHFAKGRPGDPFARAEALFENFIGQGARLPSQRRYAARREAFSKGITLDAQEIEMLNKLGWSDPE